jgi:hypothetical protein
MVAKYYHEIAIIGSGQVSTRPNSQKYGFSDFIPKQKRPAGPEGQAGR